jgi:hypothetical protein
MHTHPAAAIVTGILFGFGLKLIFFSAPTVAADVGSTKRVSIDVSEMHRQIKNLPVENFHDMTFGFSNGG